MNQWDELYSRVTLPSGNAIGVNLRRQLRPEIQASKEGLHTLIHFLAEAISPEIAFFDKLCISKTFPLELLTEVCLKRTGIRCGFFLYHYNFHYGDQWRLVPYRLCKQ